MSTRDSLFRLQRARVIQYVEDRRLGRLQRRLVQVFEGCTNFIVQGFQFAVADERAVNFVLLLLRSLAV